MKSCCSWSVWQAVPGVDRLHRRQDVDAGGEAGPDQLVGQFGRVEVGGKRGQRQHDLAHAPIFLLCLPPKTDTKMSRMFQDDVSTPEPAAAARARRKPRPRTGARAQPPAGHLGAPARLVHPHRQCPVRRARLSGRDPRATGVSHARRRAEAAQEENQRIWTRSATSRTTRTPSRTPRAASWGWSSPGKRSSSFMTPVRPRRPLRPSSVLARRLRPSFR